MGIFTIGFLYLMALYGLIQFGLVWYGMVWYDTVWFGLVLKKKNRETSCLNAKFYALWIPRSGPKVCGGENGGAAGARMSRLTLVISLESKLIKKKWKELLVVKNEEELFIAKNVIGALKLHRICKDI